MSNTPYTVLIADDDKDLVDILSRYCRRRGLQVITAHDSLTAMNQANRCLPDVICLDVEMPNGNGLSLCEMLSSHEQLATVPVIILTGRTDPDTVRRCHSLCAFYVLKAPDVWQRIEPLLDELLLHGKEPADRERTAYVGSHESHPAPPLHSRSRINDDRPASSGRTYPNIPRAAEFASPPAAAVPRLVDIVFGMLGTDERGTTRAGHNTTQHSLGNHERIPWVLCIDDDADYCRILKTRLEAYGVDVVRAEAILLDYELPDGQGDYILNRLQDNPVTRDIPVIVITGHRDRCLERKMLNMGAVCFLNKPFEFSELLDELRTHLPSIPHAALSS
jgi:DNA-binding response OmpR family regulator